jgi:prophage antirepressor-like protein
MFVAKEVGKMWGHTNITQAINRLLDDTEKVMVKKASHPDFFKMLAVNKVLSTKTQSAWFVSESGLYKLAMASNLDKAKPFKDWVTKEVLPSIRETGTYSFKNVSPKEIAMQTIREVQLSNSKTVNSMNYKKGGVNEVIDYNKENCKQVTGMEPATIRKIHGKKGKSAKEILRQTNPELAATMSLNDHFVIENGADLEELKKLDEAAISLFKEVLKLGFKIKD